MSQISHGAFCSLRECVKLPETPLYRSDEARAAWGASIWRDGRRSMFWHCEPQMIGGCSAAETAYDFQMSERVCFWCLGRDMTREHLVPRWLSEEVQRLSPGDIGYLQTDRFHDPAGAWASRTRSTNRLEVVVRAVCNNCNSGWMSQLEPEAKPTLERLLRGESVSLDASRQLLVARWCAKTAVLMDAYRKETIVLDADDRREIREGSALAGYLIRLAFANFEEETPMRMVVTRDHVISPEEARKETPPFESMMSCGVIPVTIGASPAPMAQLNAFRWRRRNRATER
jgi:hypothetical protein